MLDHALKSISIRNMVLEWCKHEMEFKDLSIDANLDLYVEYIESRMEAFLKEILG